MNFFRRAVSFIWPTVNPNATVESEEFSEMRKALVEIRVSSRNISWYLDSLEKSIRK